MPTVSEQLRRAREAQKLDIYQVGEITKIKTDHLRALESGTFDSFSAPIYIRGSVRTYAAMLKLDVPRLLADLDDELARNEKFKAPPPLTNQPRSPLDFLMLQFSRLNWRVLVGILAALFFLVLAAAIIRNHTGSRSEPLKDLGPGLYKQRPGQSGETLPLPPAAPRR